jgi:hypothetical protein
MVFNVVTEIGGLFGFLRRYGALFEEIINIINGFTTETSGAYNPVNYPNRWKNTKEKNYVERSFSVSELTPLTVISVKDRNKITRLKIITPQLPTQFKEKLRFYQKMGVTEITQLPVFKQKLLKNKIQKLKCMSVSDVNTVNPLNLYTTMESVLYTPINVNTWLKRNLTTKLGVLSWLKTDISVNVHGRTYITDDVGTISDIELLDIIKDIEMVNEI